jgi:hypothetical protein
VRNDRTTDGRSWLPVVRVAADNTIFDQQKLVRMAWRFQMPRGTRSAQPGSAGGGGAVSSVRVAHKGTFRKEGEYWSIGYGGKALRLKDTKGLRYLAHLLRHPQDEFHVLDGKGRARRAGGTGDRRTDAGTSRARWDWVDAIAWRRPLRNEPDRASPRRSRRWWKGWCGVMPRWGTSQPTSS